MIMNMPRDERLFNARQWKEEDVEAEEHADFKTNPGSLQYRDYIVVAVMGMTGAGKSSFISLLTDENVKIGHDLYSSTIDTQFFGFRHSRRKGILIDTPGFDDTMRSDSDILKDIAACFCNLYENRVHLDGLIYLHRISDPRMSGSALKNLHMFQRLCGKQVLPNVVLATTMWGEVEGQRGGLRAAERREEQLRATDEFWGGMERDGSHIKRHTGDRESAKEIVSVIVNARKKVSLDIQIEMVDKELPLDQTNAGQYLKQEYAHLRQRYEAEAEDIMKSKELAMQERDAEMAAILSEEKSRATAEIARTWTEDDKLKLDFRTLQAEKSHLVRELQSKENIVLSEAQGDSSRDPQMLEREIEKLQRGINRQEEDHRSENRRQERQIRANAARVTNVYAENEALSQTVEQLQQDKKDLERLLHRQQVYKAQNPQQQSVAAPRVGVRQQLRQWNRAQSALLLEWYLRKVEFSREQE